MTRSAGEIAKSSNAPIRSVMFWTDRGILVASGVGRGNKRKYEDAEVFIANVVARLARMRIGIEEIKQLVEAIRIDVDEFPLETGPTESGCLVFSYDDQFEDISALWTTGDVNIFQDGAIILRIDPK